MTALLGLLALPLIYSISRYNYNLFHSFADGISIVIAAGTFAVIWNSRRLVDNDYFIYAGISFLFFAFLDLLHVLGNKNMGIFPEYGNLGPTFYIAGRYVLSISLLIAPFFINRKLTTSLMFAAYSLVTSLILLSIFYWKIFPACIVEGVGLTPFKVVSDYIICFILAGAAILLFVNRQYFDPGVLRIIISSIILFIATGLTFTLYSDPFGVTNLVGHLFQITSFYLVYLAFIETSVTKPQEILYRKLKQHEETLTRNLEQLDHTNSELQREIAERKQADSALLESEAKYRNLFMNMAEEVHFWKLVRDEDGHIKTWRLVDANPPTLKTWGKTLEEIKDMTTDEIFGPGATEHYLPVVRKIVDENVPYSFEDYFPNLEKHFRFTSVPFEDHFITTGADITRIKEAEEVLRKANDELELRVRERTSELQQAYAKLEDEIAERERVEEQLRQSQKMEALGTLTGGIAHDFNNILAAIMGFTEMCLDDAEAGSLMERNLRTVLTSSTRARDLIRQMLAFSRKTPYEKKPLSLAPIVKETARLLRASIPATIQIEVNASALQDTILANATGIQQIVMNLCTNGAHAMRDAGGRLTVTVSDAGTLPGPEFSPGAYVELAVRDTGIGMEAELAKRIFEPFFTTKEPGQGTGMGLAVVYGVVKSLKGEIIVESRPGEGSTFRVFFPKANRGETSQPSNSEAIALGKESILFVDDEEMIAELGKSILERLGYKVTALSSSAEALKLFSGDTSRFDLLITDQTMPELTGLRLCEQLLKIRPDLPIILCTGHSESVDPAAVKAAGIREFLMKPLAKQELASAVRRALDGVNQGKEEGIGAAEQGFSS
jgi:signal transduction histidine kinase/ActR/RegA family two-component response regulator